MKMRMPVFLKFQNADISRGYFVISLEICSEFCEGLVEIPHRIAIDFRRIERQSNKSL